MWSLLICWKVNIPYSHKNKHILPGGQKVHLGVAFLTLEWPLIVCKSINKALKGWVLLSFINHEKLNANGWNLFKSMFTSEHKCSGFQQVVCAHILLPQTHFS
jgi:hypothetical protein